MIRITNGKNQSLQELKEDYYNLLNPKNKDGKFHATHSIYSKFTGIFKKRSIYNNYYEYIRSNLHDIITGEPQTLLQHHKRLFKIQNKYNLRKDKLIVDLAIIFNYKSFRNGKIAKWLMEELDLNVCSYCNRQYIFSIKEGDKSKMFCDFDHYFKQEDYPLLSLSFYNLIPCCSSCNSRTKHAKLFSLKSHLHPYLDSFNDIVSFTTKIKDSKIFFKNTDNFSIELIENKFTKPTTLDYKRARKTAEDFKLLPLYNKHKEIVLELIQKNIVYNDSYIYDIYNTYSNIFEDKADVYKMIIGNYVNDSDLNKRPLAKFTKDIAREFKLLLNY
jgi:hypothetical protein